MSGHDTDETCLNVLMALVFAMQPRLIVEAGTHHGLFAHVAAKACPAAAIHTADIKRYWMRLPPSARFREGDFCEMLAGLAPDFAYIDSGPTADVPTLTDVRLTHYQAAKAALAPGGLLVTHDVNSIEWVGRHEIVDDAQVVLTCGKGLAIYRKS